MTTYLVTTELRTSWWTELLRWLHIKPKRNEFKVSLSYGEYKEGQIIFCGYEGVILILRKIG